jgi:hypothetical protein
MWVFGKVQEFRKNPMMAMAGMMGGMKPPAAPAGGGGDMAAMMEMMKNMQQQQGQQQQQSAPAAGNPWSTQSARSNQPSNYGSTINVTASEVAAQAPPQQATNGSKFQEQKEQEQAAPKAEPAAASPASFFADTAAKPSSPPPNSFFSDSATASSGSGPQASGSNSASDSSSSESMIENMLLMVADNKELQGQLSQHLPESLRNEETWNWIKNNPEIRKELAKQVAPGIMEQMGDDPSFSQYANGAMDGNGVRVPASLHHVDVSCRRATIEQA